MAKSAEKRWRLRRKYGMAAIACIEKSKKYRKRKWRNTSNHRRIEMAAYRGESENKALGEMKKWRRLIMIA